VQFWKQAVFGAILEAVGVILEASCWYNFGSKLLVQFWKQAFGEVLEVVGFGSCW